MSLGQPFPMTGPHGRPSGPLHTALPHHFVYFCIPLLVSVHGLLSVGTCEFGVRHRDYHHHVLVDQFLIIIFCHKKRSVFFLI